MFLPGARVSFIKVKCKYREFLGNRYQEDSCLSFAEVGNTVQGLDRIYLQFFRTLYVSKILI